MEVQHENTARNTALTPAGPDAPWLFRMLAGWLHANHMSRLGLANTMRLARVYNHIKFSRHDHWRRSMYVQHMDSLLQENGGLTRPPIEMKDGWAIDTSFSLPHLDRVLADSEKIIAERSGVLRSDNPYRSYFQDVWSPEDCEKYPSFLDFVTSSDVLAVVAHYLKCVPALSTTLPPGIRFVESNAAFDREPGRPKDSQLYHVDYHSVPNIYVIVLLRDTTPEHGPFTFLPRSVSQKAMKALAYRSRSTSYRISDQELYALVDRKEAIEFCYPRGTVLFIHSSGCFHYGSRNAIKPRFQLMVAYTGVCRTDFAEALMAHQVYPIHPSDSRLRRMVLEKNMRPVAVPPAQKQ
jgi:hypothetical protein